MDKKGAGSLTIADMPSYWKAKVYVIRSRLDISMIFVGATTNSLSKRFYFHKSTSKPTSALYQAVANDWSQWYITLHEMYPCNNKEELNQRANEVARELCSNLNERARPIDTTWTDEINKCIFECDKLKNKVSLLG